VNDVGGHLIDQRNLAVQASFDDRIDGCKIGLDQSADFFYCHEALNPMDNGT
jgi:hypothetical protein